LVVKYISFILWKLFNKNLELGSKFGSSLILFINVWEFVSVKKLRVVYKNI